MTPELIERMARWLANLEPEVFRLSIIDGGVFLTLAQPHDFSYELIEVFWDGLGGLIELHIDQDRLYGACARAAVVREWTTEVNNWAHEKCCTAGINDSISTRYLLHQEGFAVADALIKAHGVPNWETRERPEGIM